MTTTDTTNNAQIGELASAQCISVPDLFIKAMREGLEATAVHNAVTEAIMNDVGVTAMHESMKVHDLEPYLPHRRRQRGTFSTAYVEPFCEYTKTHAGDGATVFVDASEMTAHAVLDLGNLYAAGHADHNARLQLKRTAAFDALLAFSGRTHKQQALAEFLEDWAPHVRLEFFHHDEAITIKQALASVRRITIDSIRKVDSEQKQLSANLSAFESVQASSKDPMPTMIYVHTKPYADLAERTFALRLAIHTGESVPELTLRIQNMEKHTEEMGKELAALVMEGMGGVMPVLLGKYAKAN